MLWIYRLCCCVNWQIAPYTIYGVVTIYTCKLLVKMLFMHFWCILTYFVGMKLFGTDRWQWLLIVSEVLSSKAWWLKCASMCIKSKQLSWMLKHKIVVGNFWKILKVWCFIMYHMLVVPKIYQSISSGNVKKSPRIKPDQVFWKIWKFST